MANEKEKQPILLTKEQIRDFIKILISKGRSPGSVQSYKSILNTLYDYLPDDKLLTAETGTQWKIWLEEQGFSLRTVNARISVLNSFLLYLGRRELQSNDFARPYTEEQPVLTRAVYLRLLATARELSKEKSYLLIKTLGGAGMRIQELPQLTAEAVNEGLVHLERHNHTQKRVLKLPALLQRELQDYMQRNRIESGPVFVSHIGFPLKRSSIYYYVNSISQDAQVDEEKANPRCLWKMYQSTYDQIRSHVNQLVEQSYLQILEDEQAAIAWGQQTNTQV